MFSLCVQDVVENTRSLTVAATSLKLLARPIPVVYLCLTPYLQHENTSLHVQLSTRTSAVEAGSRLMSMPFIVGNIPTSNYSSENPIKAYDDLGFLPTWFEDNYGLEEPSRVWYTNRSSSGKLSFVFTAYPGADSHTGTGARVDLREDQGGMIGNFRTIVPFLESWATVPELNILLYWDYSQSPSGTEGTWTWGNGMFSIYTGSVSYVLNTLFAVGPHLNSKTTVVTLPTGHNETFSMYWMSEAPYHAQTLFDNLLTLFTGMASFFNDTLDFYKIFLRCSTAGSFGGTAFHRNFIMDWYYGMEWSEADFIFLLSHEMVHNWPRMGHCHLQSLPSFGNPNLGPQLPTNQQQGFDCCCHPPSFPVVPHDLDGLYLNPFKPPATQATSPGIPCTNATTFYNEGIAVYYGTFLPFHLGIVNRTMFLAELNSVTQSYYTSPVLRTSDDWIHTHPWAGFDFVRLPYYRGFIYLLSLDVQLRTATNSTVSLHDIVLSLLRRHNTKQPHSISTFLTLLSPYIPTAISDYNMMALGRTIIIPPHSSLGHLNFSLVRNDMPYFEPGFLISRGSSQSNLHPFYISAILSNSRAEEAGLLVGDTVLNMTNMNWVAARLERNITLVVRRAKRDEESGDETEDMRIEYWPRGRMLVEGYQWVEMALE